MQKAGTASQEAWVHADVELNVESLEFREMEKNIIAAIAMALHDYKGNNIHDKESGIITIKPRHTLWNARFLTMTPKP